MSTRAYAASACSPGARQAIGPRPYTEVRGHRFHEKILVGRPVGLLGFRGDLASRGSAVEEVGNCYAAARQLSGSPQGRTSTLPHNWPAWSPATASLAWASIGPARSCGSAARRGGPGNADPGGRHQAADRGRAAGCRTGRGRVVEQAHRQAPVRVSTHGGSPPHPRPSQARSPPPGPARQPRIEGFRYRAAARS